MEDGEQEHEISAGRAQEGQLAWIDHELLREDRDGHRGAHGPEVRHGPAEPVRLAQDGDRGRAAGGIRAGTHDHVIRRGDRAGRRRRTLDLGDEMEPRRGQALGDRSRGGRGPCRPGECRVGRIAELRRDVAGAPGGDLGEDAAPCGAPAGRGRDLDRHARTSAAAWAAFVASAASRSARSRATSRDAAPESRIAAACVDALRQVRRPPGGDERRSRVEQDHVASRPRSAPGEDGIDERGVLGRRCRRRAARSPRDRSPSAATSTSRRTTPPGVTSWMTPAAVERQLVHAGAVDHERALGAQDGAAPRRASAPRPGPRRRRAARRAPAGFVSGPSRLKAVRTPISRRVGPAWRIAGWKLARTGTRSRCSRSAAAAESASWSIAHAERVEDVRRAGPRRDGPVAVLGDGNAGGRDDERRGRRDVERARPVAARPDDVHRPGGRVDAHHALAHRDREAGQLVHGLAAHPERHEERRKLGGRRLAVHHRAHRAVGLGRGRAFPRR